MRNRQWTLWVAGAILGVSSGHVAATPSSGVTATVWARASFVDLVDVKFKIKQGDRQVILARSAQQTVMQSIFLAPGGHTGWHSHPGPVVVLVKSGELTLHDGDDPSCAGRTYTAGEAFIDPGQGHVHLARNTGAVDTELWVTYFDVPAGAPFRIDAPDPETCIF